MTDFIISSLCITEVNGVPMMGSKAITKLINDIRGEEIGVVEHFHIIRDVNKMLNDLQSPNLESGVFTKYFESGIAQGKIEEIFLNEDLSLCFVSGKNAKVRMAVVKGFQAGKKMAEDLNEISPLLQQLINTELAQKRVEKQLTLLAGQMEAKADVATECLSSAQIVELENLFSVIFKKTRDGKLIGRIKRTMKSKFLSCSIAGLTYKDISQSNFNACVVLVKEMGGI